MKAYEPAVEQCAQAYLHHSERWDHLADGELRRIVEFTRNHFRDELRSSLNNAWLVQEQLDSVCRVERAV